MLIPLGAARDRIDRGRLALRAPVHRPGAVEFFRDSLKIGSDNKVLEEMEHLPLAVAVAPFVMMASDFLVAVVLYPPPGDSERLARENEAVLAASCRWLIWPSASAVRD